MQRSGFSPGQSLGCLLDALGMVRVLQVLPNAEVVRLSGWEEGWAELEQRRRQGQGWPPTQDQHLVSGFGSCTRSTVCREPVCGGVSASLLLRDLTEVPLEEMSCLRSHPRASWHHPAGPWVSLLFSLSEVSGTWPGPEGFELFCKSLSSRMGHPMQPSCCCSVSYSHTTPAGQLFPYFRTGETQLWRVEITAPPVVQRPAWWVPSQPVAVWPPTGNTGQTPPLCVVQVGSPSLPAQCGQPASSGFRSSDSGRWGWRCPQGCSLLPAAHVHGCRSSLLGWWWFCFYKP